ncbi:M48 family metalloprotease [Chitinophaga oryziterrae]|uniref:M48 family metalloprotease n=1 Tax=Chitinophaga oryziterrae TaxID=1031224 RepID=A0A6N8JC58_9BACT|nr:M56 family metallopeptidase [Chitinophaga oryziterrae]MVT42875.1 M48 family metalloprotease [Chitinophaga oryziterrae]
MNPHMLNNPLDITYIKSICWTLIHSLWLGIAATILAVLVLAFTRKRTAALRYNLLVAILLIFTGAVIITFIGGLGNTTGITEDASSANGPVYMLTEVGNTIKDGLQHKAGFLTTANNFLNDHAQTVVLIWIFIILIKSIQLLAGLYSINRIHRQKTTTVGEEWITRLDLLILKMGISKPVLILQSAVVSVPLVVNFLKPVILVPVGMLTKLPVDEIEAILLHELAHIRRKDFIVNIFQQLIETLFFFNPFLLWLSARIREERENCCDDAAVEYLPKRSVLVHALVSCREFDLSRTPQHALAFPGTKNHLLSRAERILHRKNKPVNRAEKAILSCCFPLIAMILMFTMQSFRVKNVHQHNPIVLQQPKDTIMPVVSNTSTRVEETLNGVSFYKYTFRRNNVLYVVLANKKEIRSLTIDGQPASPAQLEEKRSTIKKWMKDCDEILAKPLGGLKGNITHVKNADPGHPRIKDITGLKGSLSGLGGLKNDITPADSATHSYYDKGYKVVMAKAVPLTVYYKGKQMSDEEIKQQQATIGPIVKDAVKNYH